MKNTGQLMLVIATFPLAVTPVLSQTPPQKPSFEVVSIKPSAPNLTFRGGGPRGDAFTMTGVTLKTLLQVGFQRFNSSGTSMGQLQIVGGPPWLDSDRFDVQAKADCSHGPLSREQMQAMIQSMLEERFQLKSHFETHELPIYNLVAAKEGAKLKASADQTPAPIAAALGPQLCRPAPALTPLPPPPAPGQRGGPPDLASMPRGMTLFMVNPTGVTVQASAAPIGNLANLMQSMVGRPVVDKTGLTGLFDIKLQFSPEGVSLFGGGPPPVPTPFGGAAGPGGPGVPGAVPTAADPAPSIFTAIQDLGLRLESTKGPVEVLVVDSAEKPTEN